MYKDMMVKVGEYTDKNGQTKGEWVKLGFVGENQNGQYFMLDPSVNLAGLLIKQRLYNPKTKGMVMASVFDRSNNGQQAPAQAPAPQATVQSPVSEDDLPW